MKKQVNGKKKIIWIDLDNSPHVPFFRPIIEQLEKRGCKVVLTARNSFQTCALADLAGLNYKRVGRHYGKHMILKLAGIVIRAVQLVPFVLRERPDLAISHGSRSQQILSYLLRVPVITMTDYEYSKIMPIVHYACIIVPEAIPPEAIPNSAEQILRYPGLKEDVYVPDFVPDPNLREQLGIGKDEIVATIRPPATEAHYHNHESVGLFEKTIEFLAGKNDARIVMLPRNEKQKAWINNRWPDWCRSEKILFLREVVDGLNLIWCSDLVISGGGTMNREAVALGVPVYSIFRGKIGAVDRYLAENGRLTLLENEKDVRTKIKLRNRQKTKTSADGDGNRGALKTIVNGIEMVMDRVAP